MAEVTGFTADRMLSMENATIIDARLDNYNLILITKDLTEINVGDVRGPTGPTGPVGEVEEAPVDGQPYLRQDGLWTQIPFSLDDLIESNSYTPTLTGIGVGAGGGNVAHYTYIGTDTGLLVTHGLITFGSSGQTFPGASAESVSLPSGFAMVDYHINRPCGQARYNIGSNWIGSLWQQGDTDLRFVATTASGQWVDPTASVPGSWAAGSSIDWHSTALRVARV